MKATRFAIAATIAGLAASPAAAQVRRPPRQPIPPGTSAIRGFVLDNVTRQPVAGCQLEANGSGFWTTVVSGEDGAYQLRDIAAGSYFFNLQCPAHLMVCTSLPVPAPPTRGEAEEILKRTCLIDVARDQQREANFLVTPGAIARGRVLAADGRPIARAGVRLGRGIRGEAAPNPGPTPVKTDDEGRFEIGRMPAGEWRLEVEVPPVPGGLTPPTVYYPGGLSWEDATGVVLIAGQVTGDLVVTVPRINENTLTVAVPPPDGTISEVVVSVLQQSPLLARRVSINAEGNGVLKGLVPGRYFALALASSNDRRWAGFEVVDFLDGDYQSRLQLMPTGSIAGRIVVDKGAAPSFDGVIAGASWAHDGVEINPTEFAEARVAADGSFRIDDLFGTRKLQLRALGAEWEIAAVRQNRSDMTATGVDVTPGSVTEVTIVVRRR